MGTILSPIFFSRASSFQIQAHFNHSFGALRIAVRHEPLILLKNLARPEGFEPPTHRSVVCCSNPLS